MTSYEEIARRIREKLQNSEDNYLVHFKKLDDMEKNSEHLRVRYIENAEVAYWQGCIDAYRIAIQILREELRK